MAKNKKISITDPLIRKILEKPSFLNKKKTIENVEKLLKMSK